MSENWVDDFDSFRSSGPAPMDGISRAKGIKKPQTKKEVIEAELKLLEWHKLANEAALKTALLQTKNLKASVNADDQVPSRLKEDARWIKTVIEEEHMKPLEVNRDFVKEYDAKEKAVAEAEARKLENHVDTLRSLRETLEKKVDLKTRTAEYRAWKRDFIAKKEAVMAGKTLDSIDPATFVTAEKPGSSSNALGMSRQVSRGSQELATVLESLGKLADLEKRISSLETYNAYDSVVAKSGGRPAPPVDFKKKRATTDAGRTALVYAVKENRDGNKGKGGGGGTFLTGGFDDGEEDPRELAKRERQRQSALATAGQKNLKSRVQTKKSNAKDKAAGIRRHEEAMKELARRREEQAAAGGRGRGGRPPVGSKATIGVSAGIKTKNKHLSDFQNMRDGFSKRKDDLAKKLRGVEPKRPPLAPIVGGKKKGGRTPSSYRVGSQSAPPGDIQSVTSAGSGARSAAAGGGINAVLSIARRGAPATQKAGTNTRRIQSGNPIRRVGGTEVPLPMGAISVTGVTGVRSIKASGTNQQAQMGVASAYGVQGRLDLGIAGIQSRRK